MFASELMEKVRENPEGYEKKIFEVTDGYALTSTGRSVPHIIVFSGTAREGHTGNIVYFSTDTQVKETRLPVAWQEALKAKGNGKSVNYILDGVTHVLLNSNTIGYIHDAIKNGTWYIMD